MWPARAVYASDEGVNSADVYYVNSVDVNYVDSELDEVHGRITTMDATYVM